MSKIPNQRLLRWEEGGYWYTIERGDSGDGYFIRGFWDENTGKNSSPQFMFPFTQDEVAEQFKQQGKKWAREDE